MWRGDYIIMNQKERIAYFEKILNKGESIIKELEKSIEEFKTYQDKIDDLDAYFQSEERKIDVKDDENHKFPQDMKRGVLGEDYIYDLLTTWDELKEIVKKY